MRRLLAAALLLGFFGVGIPGSVEAAYEVRCECHKDGYYICEYVIT